MIGDLSKVVAQGVPMKSKHSWSYQSYLFVFHLVQGRAKRHTQAFVQNMLRLSISGQGSPETNEFSSTRNGIRNPSRYSADSFS
jgi:hypothetical protein